MSLSARISRIANAQRLPPRDFTRRAISAAEIRAAILSRLPRALRADTKARRKRRASWPSTHSRRGLFNARLERGPLGHHRRGFGAGLGAGGDLIRRGSKVRTLHGVAGGQLGRGGAVEGGRTGGPGAAAGAMASICCFNAASEVRAAAARAAS